jgi:L-fuconolactonase
MTVDSIPTIDTHVHVWKLDDPWVSWLYDRPQTWAPVRRDVSWQDLRGELDRSGIESLILVQAGMTPRETHGLLELAAAQPSILGVVGWATLTSASAMERDLDSFSGPGAAKLVGIRNNHGWEPDRDVLASAAVVDSCRVLAERHLTLDLHFADDGELPLAITLAERVPELTCVVDHLGKPRLGDKKAFLTWTRFITELSQLPNVFIKYSGWATFMQRTDPSDVKPYIDVVLEAFGSDRVMYGSNWPVALVSGSYYDTYRATLDAVAGLGAEELHNLLHRTAAKCYLGCDGEHSRLVSHYPERHLGNGS